MRDLINPKLMYLKAALLVGAGGVAAALLLADRPTLRTFALIAIIIWSFSRAYYFAFYVLERYVDPSLKFSGLISLVRHLANKGR
jgi:hypothetical protein